MTLHPERPRLPTALLCTVLSVMLALAPGRSLALGPLEKNHPLVEKGLQAYQAGRYEEALAAFDEAKRAMPENAAVEYDRGNALFKLNRLEEAKQAYQHTAELDQGELRQRDHYNLGNALAELGQTKEAIAAYRKALLLDPADDRARHNLEVVLRKVPPPPPPTPDAGSDGGSDAGQDGGSGGKGDGGQGDGGQGDGGQSGPSDGGSKGAKGDAQDAGAQEDQPEEAEEQQGRDGGADESHELSAKEVERLLDSMKQSEKNLQLWRFQQRKKSRKENAKDW